MASTIQTQDAYAAGWNARQAGVARTANPFSTAYDVQDWNFGWDDAPAHTTYVKAKDGSAQIAVVLTDELHCLCWGRLHTSNRPHEGLPVVDADPAIWIAAERVKPPVMIPFDQAGPYGVSGSIRSEAA